jgi:hypothetical protein
MAVLAAACAALSTSPASSTGPSPGASAASLVCALVPDMAGVVGREPIAAPDGYSVGGNDRCMWVLSRDPSRYVGLTIGPATNHARTIDALGPGDDVAGLGDGARWWATRRTLSVAAGDRSFQVDLQLDPGEVTQELAVAIARQVLASLGTP